MPELINFISTSIDNLQNTNYRDLSLKTKVNEQIKIINDKLNPKQRELSNLLNRIVEREGRLAKRLSASNEDISMAVNSYHNESRLDTDGSSSSRAFRDSKLVVREVVDNSEYLRKRQEELEDIKKVSGQVKELTNTMKLEVSQQGEKLKSIEENVIESSINAKKAEFEIAEAEKGTRKTSRKICWITFILFFAVASLVAIIVLVFLGDGQKK